MIDWNKSAELNGCTIGELEARFERFPGSGYIVVATCEQCGEVREAAFNNYSALCSECAHTNKEFRDATRLRTIKQFSDPAAREAMRLITLEQFATQESRDEHSAIMVEYYKDRPESGESHSEWMIEHCKDPEVLKAMSERSIQSRADHPEAWNAAVENMRGGHDIVDHHMIYDHSDLTKNTIPMTRSMHMKLHELFKKHGIIIPHINIMN